MEALDKLRIIQDEQPDGFLLEYPDGTCSWVAAMFLVDRGITVEQYFEEQLAMRGLH